MNCAVLAVGTEVTDGQIVDRNSAWISQRLVLAGLSVTEHRVVADHRADIERSLNELAGRVDFLFVTGGLGPTSDDFTRDLIAKVFSRPLEFDEQSWRQVIEKLTGRGLIAKDIQRQQCYFPRGARVLTNSAGTANAFCLELEQSGRALRVYALPGPPAEIAAIWAQHLAQELETFVPTAERDEMLLLRTLGRGESDIAEVTERVINGSGLRIGYRAHMPYVEVKLWYRNADRQRVQGTLTQLETELKAWIVNRGDEDVADTFIDRLIEAKLPVRIVDEATKGTLAERLATRVRERKLENLQLTIETRFLSSLADSPAVQVPASVASIWLQADEHLNKWLLTLRSVSGVESVLEESPPYNYKVRSDRGYKYMTEKALLLSSSRI